MGEGSDQPRDARDEERAMPQPAGDLGRPRREPDPLTVALVIFFVGLVAVVGVLLLAPLLTR